MLLSLALLHSISPALAWKHTGFAWNSGDDNGDTPGILTRDWYMDDNVEDSLPQDDADGDGIPDYEVECLQSAWDNWEETAQCAAIGNHYVDTEDLGVPQAGSGTKMYWDDPGGTLGTGVLGLTVFNGDGTTEVWNDQSYSHMAYANIIFQNNVDWGTTDDINNHICSHETCIEGVATHEIGHSWGMGHSCDENDSCTDPLLLAATMYWTTGECDCHQTVPNSDDVDGLTNIYGPSTVISGGHKLTDGTITDVRTGGLPWEVCFTATVSADATVNAEHWIFGDGETSDEIDPCHTYTTAGQFSVTAEVTISSDVCSEQTVKSTSLGYVVACEPPAPEAGADGFFEIVPTDGLTWQTINHTDVSTYGCVNTIDWEVYKGKTEADITDTNKVGDSIGAWAPLIQFPSAGDYVVVMNIGGPAGLQAGFLAVTATDSSSSCSTTGGGATDASAFVGLLAGAALIRRRRR